MFQQDEESDRSPTIAIWLGLITAAIVVISLVSSVVTGGLSSSSGHGDQAGAGHTASSASSSAGGAADPDDVLDVPLSGSLLSKVYFAVGSATLSGTAGREVKNVATDLESQEGRVMLAGFHDPSGDATFNAELAKNRAKAVREGLKAAGVPADRIVLRKPESTTTGGPAEEERRVEMRLID